MAERTSRGFAISFEGGGWGVRSIPWEPGLHSAVDPAGAVRVAPGERYRIVRLDAGGDTVLVIEADVSPEPVTGDEPAPFDVFDSSGNYRGTFRMPETIPAYFPLRFREGRLYALSQDEMDVQSVIRIPLPPTEG